MKIDILYDGINISSFSCEGYTAEEVLKMLNLAMGMGAKAPVPSLNNTTALKKTEVETYDMKELGKSIRMPKTTTNFRCPECGQAVMIVVDGEVLCRDITVKPPVLFGTVEGLAIPDDMIVDGVKDFDKIIEVYRDLLTFIGDKKFLVESEVLCECPVCQHTGTTNTFIKAYESPLDFFEEEQLCDICGEIGTIVLTENGDSVLCENKCHNKIDLNYDK